MKKGDVKIQENLLIVAIAFFILIFALIFFYKFLISNLENTIRNYQIEKVESYAVVLQNFPELKSYSYGTSKAQIDFYKLKAIKNLDENTKKEIFYIPNIRKVKLVIVYPSYSLFPIFNKSINYKKYLKVVRGYPCIVVKDKGTKEEYFLGDLTIVAYIKQK